MRRILAIVGALAFAAVILVGVAAGPFMSQVEHPPYVVTQKDGAIELRSYPSMVVASTAVRGPRDAAIQTGFRTLAGYIFGANADAQKIAMTAPVLQGRQQTELGDATVTGGASEADVWTIRFVMPSALPLDRLPGPRDPRVTLETIPTGTFAVIRFPGRWRDALLRRKTEELRAYIGRRDLVARGAPFYAFYNPPWTLPFFRRNEVMIEVGDAP